MYRQVWLIGRISLPNGVSLKPCTPLENPSKPTKATLILATPPATPTNQGKMLCPKYRWFSYGSQMLRPAKWRRLILPQYSPLSPFPFSFPISLSFSCIPFLSLLPSTSPLQSLPFLRASLTLPKRPWEAQVMPPVESPSGGLGCRLF